MNFHQKQGFTFVGQYSVLGMYLEWGEDELQYYFGGEMF
jgi:hypothetical protein